MIIGFDGSRGFIEERTGTENYSYSLLKSLATLDKTNSFVVYVRKLKAQNSKLKTKSQISKLWERGDWPQNFHFVEIPLSRLWTQVGLAYRTWIDKLDLLFVPAHTLPVFRKPGIPTVVTIHDLGYEYLPQYHEFPHKIYLNWSTVYAVKTATRLIAVSKATKKDLINKLCCDEKKINVIYEGVESGRFKKKYSKEEIDSVLNKYEVKKPYILNVGTIQPRKNLVRLIEAFSKIQNSNDKNKSRMDYSSRNERSEDSRSKRDDSSYPIKSGSNNNFEDLYLVIAGKMGWMEEEIFRAPKKFKIEDKVKFLGRVSDNDLPILYQNAECFVMPSLYEGFGLPVLEAMASGCPVIVSNTSCLPEVVGEAGILVDPYNIDSIVKAMVKVTSLDGTSNKLIGNGLERVKEFSWEKTASETLRVFEEIVK